MRYRQLGKTGIIVSEVSLGCMSLKPGNGDNLRVIKFALNAGINFFDTADLYDKGQNEELLGKALFDNRKQLVLCSKVGNQWRSDGSGWDWNPSKKYILSCIESTLSRLRTDYLDLYLLHGGTIDDPFDETLEAMESIKKQGKIRHYGISSIRPNVIRRFVARSGIEAIMMQYSLLDRRPEETALALADEHKISLLARGVLAQGMLAGKQVDRYLAYSSDEVQRAVSVLQTMVQNPAELPVRALQFVLRKSSICSAVVGIRTLDQLKMLVEHLSLPDLTDEEARLLEQSITPHTYELHR